MKSSKTNSLTRLFSFVLIAILLLCIVGFAAGGLQPAPNDEPDSGNDGNENVETDENIDGDKNQSPDNSDSTSNNNSSLNNDKTEESVLPPEPEFFNTFTGLKVTEEISKATPIAFVMNPDLPLYGISSADIAIEFPTENGSTRLLSYTTNYETLWKIGALSPTRAYISEMSIFFGGAIVSYGNDDMIKYSALDTSKTDVDISKMKDCYYVENSFYIYSGKDMVKNALDRSQTVNSIPYKSPPFIFPENGEKIKGTINAKNIKVPYSTDRETEFMYSESTDSYLMFKSGNRKVDMLNGKNVSFNNVFILFANTTTYEKAEGSELVVDTMGGGRGYYASSGTIMEIKWSIDENGQLKFTKLNGDILSVNRGNSYIGYYKASASSLVSFS